MKTATRTTQTIETEYEFTGGEIIQALIDAGKLPDSGNLTVTFTVPTGGDYSGMVVDVDSDNPMRVRCKEIIES